jgi:DNA repair protein RadC
MKRLYDLPKQDRPREKLLRIGPQALSDHELLAILLGCGTRENDVMSIATKLTTILDKKNQKVTVGDLLGLPGIGSAKAALITAALEFSRRRIHPEGNKITSPNDVIALIRHFADRKQEHFIVISLNGAHEVIATRVVSIGSVNTARIHPREIFADPLSDGASAVIVAHNHTSGSILPSESDKKVTERLRTAARILRIGFLDHIIFNKKEFYSFMDNENNTTIPSDNTALDSECYSH